MYKKLEMLRLSEQISIFLRQKFSNCSDITVEAMLDDNFIEGLLQHDRAYRFLESFPTSPAYWQREGKEIRAMIRQLGLPSFFITLSAAETKWGQLLKVLKQVIDNEILSIGEAASLPFIEKARLIRSEPVICARYFDHRVRLLLSIIKSRMGTFKNHPYLYHYWRIEVQKRGSLHLHGLFWMDKIPKFDKDNLNNISEIIGVIDQYCITDVDVLENECLKEFQMHKHTSTCRRQINNDEVCRFKIPKPPMRETMILCPLNQRYTEEETQNHNDNFKEISILLNHLNENSDEERMELT